MTTPSFAQFGFGAAKRHFRARTDYNLTATSIRSATTAPRSSFKPVKPEGCCRLLHLWNSIYPDSKPGSAAWLRSGRLSCRTRTGSSRSARDFEAHLRMRLFSLISHPHPLPQAGVVAFACCRGNEGIIPGLDVKTFLCWRDHRSPVATGFGTECPGATA